MKKTKESAETPQSALASVKEMLKESSEKFDREMKESRLEYEKRMKKLEETMGSWYNNHGRFAEEYFFNSFEDGQRNFLGEQFDDITKNVKGLKTKDKFDIVMINGHTIGLIEVKFAAHESDLPKVMKKADTFRLNFSNYRKHKIYLGLASLTFYPSVEEECIKNGIAIIKQAGDTVVINDQHLRAY
jgi:hypothetical protein